MTVIHAKKPTIESQLALLKEHGHRKVKTVAKEGFEGTPAAIALFEVAKNAKRSWRAREWAIVLAELDKCELSIDDWLFLKA